MLIKNILLVACIVILSGTSLAQQEKIQKKYFEFVETRQASEQCDYSDVFDATFGFSQYLEYDERKAVWKECEYEIVEYVILVHLSPDCHVDSVNLDVIGPKSEVVLNALSNVRRVLNQKILEWPSCDIPVYLPDESWTIVLPFSYYSLSAPNSVQLPRTATQDLKDAVSRSAKNNLSVVYPIGIMGWSVLH